MRLLQPPCHRLLPLFVILATATASHSQAAVSLNFDGGNSSTAVDAFSGTAGDIWLTPWTTSPGATGTASVIDTNPLSSGSGNYLSTDLLGGDRNVIRQYGSVPGFSVNSSHTVQWQWRLDDPFEATSPYDRIAFFADGTKSSASTSASNSWCIGVAPDLMGYDNWYFYDRQADTSFTTQNAFNTGMSLQQGTTYTFSVTVNPTVGTYNASVSDGITTVQQNNLSFRNATGGVDYLHFGTKSANTNVHQGFSLDSVEITGGSAAFQPRQADGFKGIWYANQYVGGDYVYKYSGGFATYPQQMRPQAYYAAEADKTFFTFGGTDENNSTLYHMVAYYDHATGQVTRPRILLDKQTTDAHDNPTLMLDDEGYLYVFSAAHGTARPTYIHRSTQPYSIDEFEEVLYLSSDNNFSYSNPTYVNGQGFLFLHTKYGSTGRALYYNTSADGVHWDYEWDDRPMLADIPGGQYQMAEVFGQTVGTAFNYHPGGNVNARTNLYYIETDNLGQTWRTIDGTSLTTPVTTISNAALVHDYQAEGLLVYLKDIRYDAQGNPVLLYITSAGWQPGPDSGLRVWNTAHWDGSQWVIQEAFTSDHNYDQGSLYIEDDGTWRIIAPTDEGPQAGGTGGEMVMWISQDGGQTWNTECLLTPGAEYNHGYARAPVNADDDFYALWADGNAFEPSDSSLYFTDKDGTGVWRLPWEMTTDFATPELAFDPIDTPEPHSLGLLATGIVVLALLRRRQRR